MDFSKIKINETEYNIKDKTARENIETINSKIRSLASGSPLVATSIDEMTDTTKSYVNTTDGNWYYHNGSEWVIGGTYQSTGIAEESINSNQTTFIEECTGKNKFNKDNAKILPYYINLSSKNLSSGNVLNRIFYIPCKGNEYYCISSIKTETFQVGFSSNVPNLGVSLLKADNFKDTINYKTYEDGKFSCPVLSHPDSKYMVIQIISNNDTLTIEDIIDSIQVEQGIEYTGYEECKFNLKKLSIGYDKPYSTIQLIEGTTPNANYKLWIPTNYEECIIPKIKGTPLIIGFHGNGSGNSSWTNTTNYPDRNKIRENCLNNGYMFLVVERKNQLFTWGNKECVKAYSEVLEYILETYNISKIGVFANSMGGIESLNFISEKRIPVSCYVGTSLTYNLEQIFNNGQYTDKIKEAYEISENGSDYEVKTLYKDPSKKDTSLFGSFPCYIIGATDDVAILQNENGFKFYEDMNKFSECTKVEVTGGHGFDLTNNITDIMNFYSLYLD